MFPYIVRGETRIPPEVGDRLGTEAAAARIATWLKAEGATVDGVRGGAIPFTVPMAAQWRVDSRLQLADAGVVEVREEGGAVVLAYRLRMRRMLLSFGLTHAAFATLAPPWREGLAIGIPWLVAVLAAYGMMVLWQVAKVQARFPRAVLEDLAREARLVTAPPAAREIPRRSS